MNSQPNWLDIQEQLYPQIYINKTIQVELHQQPTRMREPIYFDTQVLYNSLHREINVTTTISELILNMFKGDGRYNVFVFNSEDSKFISAGVYPFQEPVLLRGAFVQDKMLVVKIQEVNQPANLAKPKTKTDKTVKFVLQKVAKWRKIHMDSQKKITLEQSANMIGISRNTLDDYYFQIKLAEKYGFNFHEQLDEPFKAVRKFVKHHEQKNKTKQPNPQPNILSKYQMK